jgi:hypothetical protein
MAKNAPVPVHLAKPDAFLTIPLVKVGLSIKQCVMVLLPVCALGAGVTWLTYQAGGYGTAIVVAFACAGIAIGLSTIHFEGLPVERAVPVMIRFLKAPRRFVWAPGGLHKVPGVRQPRRGLMPTWWGKVKSGDIESGGFLVRGFAVGSTDFGLASDREQQGKVDGFMQLLDALDDRMQVLIRSENIDIEARANEVELAGVTPALAESAAHHASHLRGMQGGWRKQVDLIIRGEDREALDIREDTVLMLIQPMRLPVRKLSTDEIADVLAGSAGTEGPVR